ncbi:hypothetical protein FCV25MIE_29557 [Fagus crenata]
MLPNNPTTASPSSTSSLSPPLMTRSPSRLCQLQKPTLNPSPQNPSLNIDKEARTKKGFWIASWVNLERIVPWWLQASSQQALGS